MQQALLPYRRIDVFPAQSELPGHVINDRIRRLSGIIPVAFAGCPRQGGQFFFSAESAAERQQYVDDDVGGPAGAEQGKGISLPAAALV